MSKAMVLMKNKLKKKSLQREQLKKWEASLGEVLCSDLNTETNDTSEACLTNSNTGSSGKLKNLNFKLPGCYSD